MKKIIFQISIIAFSLGSYLCSAQSSDKSEIENKVKHSDIVIEVHVLSTKGFKTQTSIYTSATVKVLKIFKGSLTDTIIEVVSQYGQTEGTDVHPADGQWFALGPNKEYILFLNSNKTDNRLQKDLSSYVPSFDVASEIVYQEGNTASNLENGIFKQLESITGEKRKSIGRNMFERPAKYSLEDKVANADAIVEGEVIAKQGFSLSKTTNYGSALVRISRIFKGTVKDSVVEVVYLNGGRDEALKESYGYNYAVKENGLFFLKSNTTDVSLRKNVQSFIPFYGKKSFIAYAWADSTRKSYVAHCDKTTYTDVAKELFKRIEQLSGQKAVIWQKNLFEK